VYGARSTHPMHSASNLVHRLSKVIIRGVFTGTVRGSGGALSAGFEDIEAGSIERLECDLYLGIIMSMISIFFKN
jgi:hypothetical protein